MKKFMIPLILAVLFGVTTGTAAIFVNAKKAAGVLAKHVADSVQKYVVDSTATADSLELVHKAEKARIAAEAAAAAIPLTPADSIRAAQSQATTLKAATHGLPNATEAKGDAAPGVHASSSVAAPAHAPDAAKPTTAPVTAAATKPAETIKPKIGASPVPVSGSVSPPGAGRTTPANVPAAVENGLPEHRIAKIFGAMQSRDAAKVLEQMNDSDVRTILSMMGDKQAAAILVLFPAQRAAIISKGEIGKGEKKSPGVPQ